MIKRWPTILLIVLPLLVYWRLTFAGRVLYWGLPIYQFYPWHRLVTEALQAGHLPLWTDLLGNGTPLLANHQSAVFYPLNLIYLVMPVEHAMTYSVVLHIIMAGLFAYAWGQAIGLSRWGACITGLTFMLSGFFVSRTQFITIVNAAAWLPLLFLLAERLVRRQTLLGMVWLGLALALQFLAGHAQLWFYSLWAVAVYGIARARWCQGEQRPDQDVHMTRKWLPAARPVALLAGALLLSLGLSGLQLVPTTELSFLSQRVDGLDPVEAMTYSFWPWRLMTLAIPDLFGSPATGDYWGYATYWEDAGYIGVLPLLLGLSLVVSLIGRWVWAKARRWLRVARLACFSSTPRSGSEAKVAGLESHKIGGGIERFVIIFCCLLMLVSLVLAMGHNTPIYPLVFRYVPGFGAFRAPARFLLFYTLAASTLAGLAADRFRLTYRVQYVGRLAVAGAVAMLAVSLAVGQMALPIKPTFASAIARFALLLGVSALILLLCPSRAGNDQDTRVARSPLRLGVWQGLLIVFISLDLVFFAMPLTPDIAPSFYRSSTEADRFLLARTDDSRLFATYDYDYDTKFNRYFDFSAWGPSELAYWLSFRETLVPNLNLFTHTPSVNNDDPLVVGRWRKLMDILRTAEWPNRLRLLRMMNVGYLLAESPPPELSRVENIPNLYRLFDPLPRAWVVSQARVLANPNQVLAELMAETFDPTVQVLLESPPPPPDALRDSTSEANVALNDDLPSMAMPSPQLSPITGPLLEEANRRTIQVAIAQPAYLVLAYTYYPGWRATVDGRPTEILRANYVFMALPLEAGRHSVVLHYQPVSLTLGLLISSLSLLVVVGIIVSSGTSRRSRADQRS